ncbi:hypothetical protein F4859DRAFT_521625 [Xylaria cf. heliscus]|nr:hypothetical protein F4859DRAFT_521625 [Xylaria cf. heliscus]
MATDPVMPAARLANLWHGAEVDEHRYPAFSAWKQAQGEIDRHLEDAVMNPGVTALSLTSNPATGKSTTLMRHIAELAMVSKAPRHVLYIVPTQIEAYYISSWLLAHGVLDTSAAVGGLRGVKVMTTEVMVKMFTEQDARWPDHLTIAFDINWYPTVDDEMALAVLLQWAGRVKESGGQRGIHMAIVLLMSGFESARTIYAFRKRLGDISQINLDTHHIYPTLTALKGDWKKDLRGSIGHAHTNSSRIVIGAGLQDVWSWKRTRVDGKAPAIIPDFSDPVDDPVKVLLQDLDILANNRAIHACAQVPFALGLANVSHVVCSGEIGQIARFDSVIMQTVIYRRRMMRSEILRVLSWGIRSDKYGTAKNPVLAAPAADYDALNKAAEADRDNLGDAWGRDLWFLILKVFKVWPGLRIDEMPTRPPLDIVGISDSIRALLVLECLEEQEEGWKCTALGLQILRVRREMGSTLSFNVAFLLARVAMMQRQSNASPVVALVLIHMAAIAHVGSSEFFHVKGPVDREALAQCLPAVVPKERWCAGFLWVGLGLYLFGCRGSMIPDKDEDESPDFPEIGGIDVDIDVGIAIRDLAKKFARYTRVTLGKLQDSNWDMERLSEADLETIELELMWAWLHRIAMFWASPISESRDVVSDMVSFVKFDIEMDTEVIDAPHVREYSAKRNKGEGAFFVLYEELRLKETSGDGQDSSEAPRPKHRCRDVTWIPSPRFKDVQRKSGYKWPDAVGRSLFR